MNIYLGIIWVYSRTNTNVSFIGFISITDSKNSFKIDDLIQFLCYIHFYV